MADVDFPSFLRGAIKASKSRDTQAAFRESNPFSGPPYIQNLTDDTPSVYNIEFKFHGNFKRAFYQWFIDPDYCDKGRAEFNFPLEVESGIEMQEARFLADGIPQLVSESGGVYTYSARIIIRELSNSDDGFTDELLFLLDGSTCGEFNDNGSLLDYAMNQDFPED